MCNNNENTNFVDSIYWFSHRVIFDGIAIERFGDSVSFAIEYSGNNIFGYKVEFRLVYST